MARRARRSRRCRTPEIDQCDDGDRGEEDPDPDGQTSKNVHRFSSSTSCSSSGRAAMWRSTVGRARIAASESGIGTVDADQRLDDLVELRRVRGRNDHPAPGTPRCWQPPIEAGGRGRVGAPHSSQLVPVAADRLADVRVAHRAGLERTTQRGTFGIEPVQAFEVTGVAHVHRGCKRSHARPSLPDPAGDVVGDRTIGVARQHDVTDWQAHLPRPDAGEGIAQVAGRNDEAGRSAVARRERKTRGRVIHHLRQQAADVDAVRRGQCERLRQGRIREGALDQALAVVEGARHRERPHVVAPAGELLPLTR